MMNDQPQPTSNMPDPTEMSRTLAGIAVRSQRLLVYSMRRQMEPGALPEADPLNVSKAFIQVTIEMMANPVHMLKSNLNLWKDYLTLWNNSTQRMLGQDTAPIIEPWSDDRRFHEHDDVAAILVLFARCCSLLVMSLYSQHPPPNLLWENIIRPDQT